MAQYLHNGIKHTTTPKSEKEKKKYLATIHLFTTLFLFSSVSVGIPATIPNTIIGKTIPIVLNILHILNKYLHWKRSCKSNYTYYQTYNHKNNNCNNSTS